MNHNARQRARKACYSCRRRKVRCDFDDVAYPLPPCGRCKKAGLLCEVSAIENRGGFGNVLKGKLKKRRHSDSVAVVPPSAVGALQHELYTAGDALNILNHASRDPGAKASDEASDALRPKNTTARNHYKDAEKSTRGKVRIELSPIVKDGVLSVAEATVFVELFFTELASFYAPFIPKEYSDIEVLAARPALHAVICTVGAKLKNDRSYDERHARLWDYLQQTISYKLWNWQDEEVRSIIFSIIILCEWIPQALFLPKESSTREDAIAKHARICWPLLGQALRLAQFTGILQYDVETFIALHFADHLYAARMGLQPMMFDTNSERNRYIGKSMQSNCSIGQRARLDCAKLFQLANSSLYSSRESMRQLIASGRHLTTLQFLFPLVEKWERDYNEIVASDSWGDRSITFEFCYCQLYIFSIALVTWQDEANEDKLIAYDDLRKYLDLAISAARYIIELEASDITLNLRFAPIMWILRLLHASLFLAKTLLVRSVHCKTSERRSVVKLIQTAGDTMKKLLPEGHENYFNVLRAITSHFSEGGGGKLPVSNMPQNTPHASGSHAARINQHAEKEMQSGPMASDIEELSEDAIFDLLGDAQALVGFGESLPSMTTPWMSPDFENPEFRNSLEE